jgi:hypothetical protein
VALSMSRDPCDTYDARARGADDARCACHVSAVWGMYVPGTRTRSRTVRGQTRSRKDVRSVVAHRRVVSRRQCAAREWASPCTRVRSFVRETTW